LLLHLRCVLFGLGRPRAASPIRERRSEQRQDDEKDVLRTLVLIENNLASLIDLGFYSESLVNDAQPPESDRGRNKRRDDSTVTLIFAATGPPQTM
jgi:hypothetical protein